MDEAHSVFGQVVSDHTVLPHLLSCFGRLRKLCRLLPVPSLFWHSGRSPQLWLRLPTLLLRLNKQTNKQSRLVCGYF